MKKYIVILILICTSVSYTQPEFPYGGIFEIYVQVLDPSNTSNTVRFEIYNDNNPIWEKREINEKLPITSELNYAHATDRYLQTIIDIPASSDKDRYGIWHTNSFLNGQYRINRTFGNGKYKLYMRESNGKTYKIYLDYTTSDYPKSGTFADIWIRYTIKNSDYMIEIKWDDDGPYQAIIDNETYNIWDYKNGISKSTFKLELYTTISNQNNHPYLQWNQYHDPNIIGYYLYRVRKYGTTVKIALNSNTTSYIDTDITMGTTNGVYVSYWVTARINSTTESLSGNTVKTKGEFLPQKISADNESEEELTRFRLSANYPNPFNPSTTISYQIPQKGYVTLKIYNTLGEEISTLVNETKEKGVYSVIFNAGNLPSGIYFYRIAIFTESSGHSDKTESGRFTDVKKMLLVK